MLLYALQNLTVLIEYFTVSMYVIAIYTYIAIANYR